MTTTNTRTAGTYVTSNSGGQSPARDRRVGTYTGTGPVDATVGTFVSSAALAARPAGRYTASQRPTVHTATGSVRTATGTIRTATGSVRTATGTLRVRTAS